MAKIQRKVALIEFCDYDDELKLIKVQLFKLAQRQIYVLRISF